MDRTGARRSGIPRERSRCDAEARIRRPGTGGPAGAVGGQRADVGGAGAVPVARQSRIHHRDDHVEPADPQGSPSHAQVPFLAPLQPWLLNTHWDAYQLLFHTGAPLAGIAQSLALSGAYVAVFGASAWLRFRETDILA